MTSLRRATIVVRMTKAKAPAPKIDWLIGRVLHAARKWVAKGARLLSEDEERRRTRCMLVIDGSDPIALAYYHDCLRAGMHAPPKLNPQKVATMTQRFEGVLLTAASHYDLSELVDPPFDPGQVRVLVLTLGTLTLVHVDADGEPVGVSPSIGCLRPDVLLTAVAAWRNDRPEGFLLNAVFKTRRQGQRFMTNYLVRVAEVEASGPTRDAIERELLQFKPTYGGRDVPFEVQSRVYAQIGWLEKAKLLPDDSFNGLVFNYGCEMDLEESREGVAPILITQRPGCGFAQAAA